MGQQRPRSSETAPGLGSILPRRTASQKGDHLLDEGIAVSMARARRPAETTGGLQASRHGHVQRVLSAAMGAHPSEAPSKEAKFTLITGSHLAGGNVRVRSLAPFRPSACHFRSPPINGHRQTVPACRKRANIACPTPKRASPGIGLSSYFPSFAVKP